MFQVSYHKGNQEYKIDNISTLETALIIKNNLERNRFIESENANIFQYNQIGKGDLKRIK